MISSNKQSYMYAAFVCEVSFSSVHNATKWFYIQDFPAADCHALGRSYRLFALKYDGCFGHCFLESFDFSTSVIFLKLG